MRTEPLLSAQSGFTFFLSSELIYGLLFSAVPGSHSVQLHFLWELFLHMPTSHSIPTFLSHPTFFLFQWWPDNLGLDFEIAFYCQDLFDSQYYDLKPKKKKKKKEIKY